MKKALSGAVVLWLVTGLAPAQKQVSFCDLARSPREFSGHEVTVRATHRYGFEWSELYCLDCLDRGKAWLEFSSELDDASEKALKRMPKGAGIVNVTVRGVFYSGRTYGHENGYRHKFVATEVRNVVVLVKGMKLPETEREAEARGGCGGSNPR